MGSPRRSPSPCWVVVACTVLFCAAAPGARAAQERQRPSTLPVLDGGTHKLDIVIAHYHAHTLHEMLTNWTRFLEIGKIKDLRPSVYIYSLNNKIELEVYEPLVADNGGAAFRLNNTGREGAVYLAHIVNNWDNLADHTIFSQAVAPPIMNSRIEHLFGPKTGVLALSIFGHEHCKIEREWLPRGQLTQLYSIFVRRFCPLEGYSAMFNGQMLVSRDRIRRQPKDVYEHVQSLLTASMTHWIHTVHDDPHFKSESNPFFGHSMERAWSLAFDCHELWRYQQCARCDHKKWRNCAHEACQCLDP